MCFACIMIPVATTVPKDKDTEIEMDRTCLSERRQSHHQKCANLDTSRQKKTGKATNDLQEQCRETAAGDGMAVTGGQQQRLLETYNPRQKSLAHLDQIAECVD